MARDARPVREIASRYGVHSNQASTLRTGSIYGSPKRVREQVEELRDVGIRHLLCQTGFGDMSHEQNLASMRRFSREVIPAFATD